VRYISDGDSLLLSDGRSVRLIGVDTPEFSDASRNRQNARRNGLDERVVASFASQAKTFTRSLVEGESVRLEYDWQRFDRYGRTLAYVYRQKDGLLLNAEIIRKGYGFPYFHFPFRLSEEFRMLGEEARAAGRGLWHNGTPK
jgi:micrococcal nuclease